MQLNQFKENKNRLLISFIAMLLCAFLLIISLGGNIENVFYQNIGNKKEINIYVDSPKVAFIERNVNSENDAIVVYDIKSGKSEKIIQEGLYKKISGKQDVVAFVKAYQTYEDIILLNTKSKDISLLNIGSFRVLDLIYSEAYKSIIFTAYPVDENGFTSGTSELFVYDVEKKEIIEQNYLSEIIMEPSEMFLSNNNRTLLVKDERTLSYYFVDIIDSLQKPVLLGKYSQSGGFNTKGNEVIFNRFDFSTDMQEIVFLSNEIERAIPNENFILDPIFFEDGYIYSEFVERTEGGRGIYNLRKCINENCEFLFADKENSYEKAIITSDSRYLVFEKYSIQELNDLSSTRPSPITSKPMFGKLVIYDLFNKKIVFETFGIEASLL